MTDPSSKAGPAGDAPYLEPLGPLARFAYDWAETLCQPEHGCASYHKMWTLVRLIETGGQLPVGVPFFNRELPRVARDGRAHVVLSGGADTGLMTVAANALARAGITPRLSMIDRCATPLEQSKLFAAASGLDLTTHRSTPDWAEVTDADAVLAHSFLVFIPPAERPALFTAWARMLRIGGRVLMSQRLVPPGGIYSRDRPSEEIRQRRERLAAALGPGLPVRASSDEILGAAERLWTNTLGGNGTTAEDIHRLAAGAGFKVTGMTADASRRSRSPFATASDVVRRPRTEIVLTRVA